MADLKCLATLFLACLLPATASGFCFEEAGNEYGVSPLLLWGIARHESGMNPAAVGRNGNGTYDYGLMQINSRWAKVLGIRQWMKLGEPCTNVRTGAWILAQCVRSHGYNWKAVGCYHSNTPGRRERYAGRIASIIADKSRERGRYRAGETRYFFVSKVRLVGLIHQNVRERLFRVDVLLSRTSRHLPELLLKMKCGTLEISCPRRIAGRTSIVVSKERLPKEVIQEVSAELGERVKVTWGPEKVYQAQRRANCPPTWGSASA